MRRILLIILLPLLLLAIIISTFIIESVTGYTETNISEDLLYEASSESLRLENIITSVESSINVMALSLGVQFDSVRYEEEMDSYLREYRDLIAPLIEDTAQYLPNCKGTYFMFAPGYGSVPSQVWYNDEKLDGNFKRIFEYPPPEDFDPQDPNMDYYYETITSESAYWSHPYVDLDTDVLMFSYCTPVWSGDNLIGIAGFDITLDTIVDRFINIQFLDSGYGFLLSATGEVIYHPLFPFNTPVNEALGEELDFLIREMFHGPDHRTVAYTFQKEKKRLAYKRMSNGWVLGITTFEKEMFIPVNDIRVKLILISTIIFLCSAFISFFVARFITKPIIQLTSEIQKSTKEFDLLISDSQLLKRKDELGNMAREFRELQIAFQDTLIRIIETNINLERMAQIGNQVGSFTHEIKSPIGVLLTSITFAKDNLDTLKKKMNDNTLGKKEFSEILETLQKSLDLGIKNIEQTKGIVASFKDNAVSQSRIKEDTVNLHKLIEDLFAGILMQHRDMSIDLVNETTGCPPFKSQVGYIIQILTNLINNSILHGFHDREEGTIRISCAVEGKWIQLDYSDNGSGIPTDYESRIFEPYFTSAEERGGTGLGLHIIRLILSNYLKGTIEYIKRDEPGALFRILIPLQ